MKDTRNDQVSAANNNYSLLALADSEDERERMVFSTAIPSCSFLLWSSLSSAISSNTRPPSRAYRPLALRPVTMVMEVKRRSALYIGMGRNSLKTEPTVQAFYQPTLLQLYLSVYSEPVGLPTIVETLPGCCYRRSTGRLFR